MTAFWSGTIFLFYGCVSLMRELTGRLFGLAEYAFFADLPDKLAQPIGGMEIPVLGMDLSPALLIVTSVFLGGTYLFNRWLERPKRADQLIDTESEMKKVTWPSLSETMSNAITVIMTVVILMAILAFFDFALGNITDKWIF